MVVDRHFRLANKFNKIVLIYGFQVILGEVLLGRNSLRLVKKMSLFPSKDALIKPVFEAMSTKNVTSPFGYSRGVLTTAEATHINTWLILSLLN